MSTQKEFVRWLQRPEKTFTENLQFALKAWQSAEFTLANKYELVLQWVASNAAQLGVEAASLQATELTELLQLKCQPGLVETAAKQQFVEALLQLATNWQSPESRQLPELLHQLTEWEILQDLYRSNYELYAKLFGQLLLSYEQYLEHQTAGNFLQAHESEFFVKIMATLKESARKIGNPQTYEQQYTLYVLQPLAQVLLRLQQHELRFFDDLLELEKLLCEEFEDAVALERIMRLPMHVCLLTLECAIVSRRGVEEFQRLLLERIFQELPEVQQQQQSPALTLTIAAYTLEMFRKHDIIFNLQNSSLGGKIFAYVQQFYTLHLQQVLQLLCATLRLNPLILEQNIFEMTALLIVAPKRTAHEQQLYEEFLMLLMDMFRKLSRAEKFVVYLLKALKEWLGKNKLDSGAVVTKGKRKSKAIVEEHEQEEMLSAATPQKKPKLNAGTTSIDATQYLQIIFKEFNAAAPLEQQPLQVLHLSSFPQLCSAWPWSSVGVAFSKLIVGLMSKPSLTIWKSLLYSLKDTLSAVQSAADINENLSLQLDFIAALLCQYFSGAKLAEQSDKFWSQIEEHRQLTAVVLSEFGHLLLGRSHNKRSMNAFLECCYFATSFDLIVWFYRCDRLSDATPYAANALQLHQQYLSDEEWTLMQQRVINFGKSNCKYNFNRLLLQRAQARMLFTDSMSEQPSLSVQKILLTPAVSAELEQLQLLLQSTHAGWLLRNLQRDEKLDIIRLLISDAKNFDDYGLLLEGFVEDLEFFELFCLGLYERLAISFAATTKRSILAAIEFDALKIAADAAADKRMQQVAEAINAKIEGYSLKKLPTEEVQQLLNVLKRLPIGHCRRQIKGIIFALHLALYRDLKAAKLDDLAAQAFDIFTDLLHFGQQIQILKYFSAQNMLQILPVSSAWEFYEFLFSSMKNEEKGAALFLDALIEILKSAGTNLTEDQLRLALLSIETLSSLSGPGTKRLQANYLDKMLSLYATHINGFFGATDVDKHTKRVRRFVEKTLPGFAPYVKSMLAKHNGAEKTELSTDFRKICKIYIGYSMNYHNTHAIKLITVALNNRQQLHFDQDEIEFVLNGYWQQLNADLRAQQLNEKNAESVIKLIIANKTNEDLLLMLKDIGAHLAEEKDFANVTHLLTLIAKFPFSTIKGAIFNDQFKQITLRIILRMQTDANFLLINTDLVLLLLSGQQSFVENKMIPVSADTMDDILAFLMNINIKKFQITDTNAKLFNSIHLAMTELCTALLKQRHVLLMDRIPQFTHIFKDLLQSIVCYKSERQKDTALSKEEIDDLVELSLKLEALMHIIATHSLEVKRVAPFVLTFAINLMVSNKRPTTLYPKIKTHIENICYDLIGICDHRVGRFILRCSNEAARQVYELLVKDHKKYFKFKGKV